MPIRLSRRGRWLVPAAAVVVTGGVVVASQLTIAQAAPALPARTPAQLLAQVSADAKLPPLTGTVVETASLGLPQLPQAANPTALSSLLTGSHTLQVYYESPQHFRLQVPQTLSETDLIRDGNKAWLWQSAPDTVTEYTWPNGAARRAPAELPAVPALTPQQAANELLAAVGTTTTVTLQSNVLVAGEPAYQLVLAPKDPRSLIGRVVIAIDGKYGVPLRVQVFASGATSPAFQVGYTRLSFGTPAPANLQFTPPPGATLTVVNLGTGHGTPSGGAPDQTGFGLFGSGWLTVAELPQSDLSLSRTVPGSSGPSAPVSSGPGGLGGDSQAVLSALLAAARPVHGSWGSGTLLTSSLVSVLMTDGEVYVGAVQPSVLYAAVGHTAG
ncbi:outer membrane lipoprotein carrier protein LolA [Trebonia sp.]|uniref:LolA family protein n=1 Tax=Trebonia sp. TaxID=2767075 RepID=UPI002609AD78|nr:outer membrane lipoprotein carrier protein LolA [Trebonia sp.]